MTTGSEFDALLAEFRAAYDELDALDAPEVSENYGRAFDAVRAARPTDPASMGRHSNIT